MLPGSFQDLIQSINYQASCLGFRRSVRESGGLRRWPPTVHADRVGGHLTLFEVLCRRNINTPSLLLMRCISPAVRPPGTQGAQRSCEPMRQTPHRGAPGRLGAVHNRAKWVTRGASVRCSPHYGAQRHTMARIALVTFQLRGPTRHIGLLLGYLLIHMREKTDCYFYL